MLIRTHRVLAFLAGLPQCCSSALFLSTWFLVTVWMHCPANTQAQDVSAKQAQSRSVLEVGKASEGKLAGGQSDDYLMQLEAGSYAKLEIEQRGIDLSLIFYDLSGQIIAEGDRTAGNRGRESIVIVAKETGAYRLTVQTVEKDAPVGQYQVTITELQPASKKPPALIESIELYTKVEALKRQGKYLSALPLAERALMRREELLGKDHLELVEILNSLAEIYRQKWDALTTEQLLSRALSITETTLGTEHPMLISILNDLGRLQSRNRDFAKAEISFQRAMTILEKYFSPDHPWAGKVLANLASLHLQYRTAADTVKADQMLKRATAIQDRKLSPDHPDHVRTLYVLSERYYTSNESVEYLERALAIIEKSCGPNHPDLAPLLSSLGYLYQRNFDKAVRTLERAVNIYEQSFGSQHARLGGVLTNLGTIHLFYDKLEIAERYYLRAIEVAENALGPNHPDLIPQLANFAILLNSKGDYAKAIEIHRRTLTLLEKVYGPDAAESSAMNNLALVYLKLGDWDQAVSLMDRAANGIERNLTRSLVVGSEDEKLSIADASFYLYDNIVTLHTRYASNNPMAMQLALNTILRRKGRVLDTTIDSLAVLRRHADAIDKNLLDQLAAKYSQIATLTLQGPNLATPDIYQQKLKRLNEEKSQLEEAISARAVGFRTQIQPFSLELLKDVIPPASALVEFARYFPRDLKTNDELPARYAAYVVKPLSQPEWVDLGEAAEIEKMVENFRQSLRDSRRHDVRQLGRTLDELIMRPVRKILGDTRFVLLSPDGVLNLVPFAALVDEHNQYLVNHYSLSYLTSGRDLLRLQAKYSDTGVEIIFANPAFDEAEEKPTSAENASAIERDIVKKYGGSSQNNNSIPSVSLSDVFFKVLPGTAGEAVALKKLLPQGQALTGKKATEGLLKQVNRPRILHIATHGFFVSEILVTPPSPGGATKRRKIENPLLRSGVALAGANNRKSGNDDGILTGLEAAGLDLWGTKLVVLSACDTGIGETISGEGLFGLRRAFVLAGSETQVMSLWSVSDQGTKELMIEYYKRLLRGEGRGEALRQVQLQMLKNPARRHPFYWASFIQSGEWANLDGKR